SFIVPTSSYFHTLSLHDALPISKLGPALSALRISGLGACKILSSKKVYSSVSSLQAGHATFILPKMKMIRNRFGPDNAEMVLARSEEHTSELQSDHLVCRLLLEK